MKVDRKKLEIAMARACASAKSLSEAAGMPLPTVRNVVSGRSVKPVTLGRFANALGVDPAELIEEATR